MPLLKLFFSVVSPAYYYGKKKKVTRPSTGENSPDSGISKPARRRKKRKSIFVQKKRRSSAVDYTPAGSPQVRPSPCPSLSSLSLYIFLSLLPFSVSPMIPPIQVYFTALLR